MIQITNEKVLSLEPRWAPFVGFSILFDNPGESLLRVGQTETMCCEVDSSPELELYRKLSRTVLDFAQSEVSSHGICLLPPTSYHVTFFDCGNQGNARDSHPTIKSVLMELLNGLPESWTEEHELVRPAVFKASECFPTGELMFRFSKLRIWNNMVLVAGLEPSDERSASILETLVQERSKLSSHYRSTYGFGAGPKYGPHVSLAYFANEAVGENASERISQLDAQLRERTDGLSIKFNSMSAYAFTDMATFFRQSRR